MFRRLRSRIILSFCVLMVGGGALSTTLVSHNMARSLGEAVDRSGLALAHVVADELTEPLAYGDRLTVRRILTGAESANQDLVYLFVTDPQGGVTDHSFPANRFPRDLLAVAEMPGEKNLRTESGPVRHLSLPIMQGVLGTLHVGLSMTWVDAATAEAVGNVVMTTVLAVAAGVAGILFLAHLITRPVLALRDAADRLGAGEADARAPVVGSDELADLARTFNRMADQIRDRMAESEALRAYVERVLDQMESSILVVAGDGTIEYANKVARDRHGSLSHAHCARLMHDDRPCEVCPVHEVLKQGTVVARTFEAPSGRTYELKWVPILGRDGRPAVVERALDVTERLELQKRLQQAHRLAVAGEIAAGVVHSVNNPLDGVRRALDLALARPDDPERLTRVLDLAKEGTDRIAGITRTLLGFARGGETRERVPVQVDALVEAAVNLTRLRAEARGLDVRMDLEPNLPAAWLDPQAMEEVLVNLLLNAVDACEDGDRITVGARVRSDRLVLEVSDTGPGVRQEVAGQVFEPFFTTKDAARGTGLGLALARRIVEAHGGELRLDRDRGPGARFVIEIALGVEEPQEATHA